jgi:hypothetical protein
VRDVYKERDVRNAPSHVVLIYRCPDCESTDRVVKTKNAWDADSEGYDASRDSMEVKMKEFNLDMGLFDTVDDLVALWRSYRQPPLREGHERKCMCVDCQKKRFI